MEAENNSSSSSFFQRQQPTQCNPPASLIDDDDDDDDDDGAAMTSHNAFTPLTMKLLASTISPGSEELHRRVNRKSGREQHHSGSSSSSSGRRRSGGNRIQSRQRELTMTSQYQSQYQSRHQHQYQQQQQQQYDNDGIGGSFNSKKRESWEHSSKNISTMIRERQHHAIVSPEINDKTTSMISSTSTTAMPSMANNNSRSYLHNSTNATPRFQTPTQKSISTMTPSAHLLSSNTNININTHNQYNQHYSIISPATPSTQSFMHQSSPFQSSMQYLDERLKSMQKMEGKLDSKIDELYGCSDEEEDCHFGALYDEIRGKEFRDGDGCHRRCDSDDTSDSHSCTRQRGSGGNDDAIVVGRERRSRNASRDGDVVRTSGGGESTERAGGRGGTDHCDGETPLAHRGTIATTPSTVHASWSSLQQLSYHSSQNDTFREHYHYELCSNSTPLEPKQLYHSRIEEVSSGTSRSGGSSSGSDDGSDAKLGGTDRDDVVSTQTPPPQPCSPSRVPGDGNPILRIAKLITIILSIVVFLKAMTAATSLQRKMQHCTVGTVSRRHRVPRETMEVLGHIEGSPCTQLADSWDPSSCLSTEGDLDVVREKRRKADDDDYAENDTLFRMKRERMLLKEEVERLREGLERTQRELMVAKGKCEEITSLTEN